MYKNGDTVDISARAFKKIKKLLTDILNLKIRTDSFIEYHKKQRFIKEYWLEPEVWIDKKGKEKVVMVLKGDGIIIDLLYKTAEK